MFNFIWKIFAPTECILDILTWWAFAWIRASVTPEISKMLLSYISLRIPNAYRKRSNFRSHNILWVKFLQKKSSWVRVVHKNLTTKQIKLPQKINYHKEFNPTSANSRDQMVREEVKYVYYEKTLCAHRYQMKVLFECHCRIASMWT